LPFILVTIFVDMLGYGMIVPLLPFYVQSQQGGASLAGLLGSLYALMQFLSGPILGALSDRFGRKPVLLVCLFGTAIAYVLLGFANTLSMLFFAVILDGVTGGNVTTAYAYVADVTPREDRARGMGLASAAFGLGVMAGPAFGGLLSSFGLGAPAFVASAIALGNTLYGWVVLPESLPPDRRAKKFAWRSLNSLSQLSALFRRAPIRSLLISIFLVNLAFSGLQTNFPLFSNARFGWDARQNGIFFAFVGLCAVLTQGVLLRLAQTRFGEHALVIGGIALMSLGLLGVALSTNALWLYPIVAIAAFGSGLGLPTLSAMISNRTSEREQGKLMGGTQALLSIANVIAPMVAGFVFERIGISMPYVLGGGLTLVALFVLARVDPKSFEDL
jgi:MFS family permease